MMRQNSFTIVWEQHNTISYRHFTAVKQLRPAYQNSDRQDNRLWTKEKRNVTMLVYLKPGKDPLALRWATGVSRYG